MLMGWGVWAAGGEEKPLSARELIQNLETLNFTGSPLALRLRGAPIRNLFEPGPGPIPPVFPTHSGLVFSVDSDVDVTVSLRSDGEPWDRVLWRILEANHLRALLHGKGIRITHKSGEPVIKEPETPTPAPEKNEATFRPPPRPLRKTAGSGGVVLPQLHRPGSLQVHGERLFIVDGVRILIFSLRDLSLIRVFGKRGQGPGEFTPYPEIQDQGSIRLFLGQEEIWVGSRNKVSLFTLTGDFIRDIPMHNPAVCGVMPFGQGFAGFEVSRFPKWRHDFFLYQPGKNGKRKLLSVSKAIHTEKSIRKGPKLVLNDLLYQGPEFRIFGDSLFIMGRAGRFIDVFGVDGKREREINCNFPGAPIREAQKKKILAIYRQRMRNIWPQASKVISIPGQTPRFRTFRVADERIFVQTYHRDGEGTVFFVLSLEGKAWQRAVVPLIYRDLLTPFPFTIKGNMVYTLAENEESGDWELFRKGIEGVGK